MSEYHILYQASFSEPDKGLGTNSYQQTTNLINVLLCPFSTWELWFVLIIFKQYILAFWFSWALAYHNSQVFNTKSAAGTCLILIWFRKAVLLHFFTVKDYVLYHRHGRPLRTYGCLHGHGRPLRTPPWTWTAAMDTDVLTWIRTARTHITIYYLSEDTLLNFPTPRENTKKVRA